jgi:hypothetical protein
MEMLAEGFVRERHEVKVVTATSEVGSKPFPFDVVRNSGSAGSLASPRAVAAISLLSRLAPLGSGR